MSTHFTPRVGGVLSADIAVSSRQTDGVGGAVVLDKRRMVDRDIGSSLITPERRAASCDECGLPNA